MKIRNAVATSLLLGIVGQTSTLLAQEPLQCIENPEREFACERLIVKKTDPAILRDTALDTPTVCICIADFMPDENTGEMPDQAEQWLQDWGLTRQDLIDLLRY